MANGGAIQAQVKGF